MYLEARGLFAEGLRWCEALLALPATDQAAPAIRAGGHYSAGVLAFRLGERDRAWSHSVACLDLARLTGNERRITRALNSLGLLAISWGESEVTFELVPEGKNVRLILTHRRLSNRADMVQTSGGWHTHLDVLVERANGRVPKAFWTVFGDIESQYEARYPK